MHHPNAMVGENRVHLGDLVSRHVTTRAIAGRDRACRPRMVRGLFRRRCHMAAQAFPVVSSKLFHEWLVRIMASEAGDPRISLSPAAAAFQTICGEAGVIDSAIRDLINVPPRAVTRAAEIYRRAGVEVARIDNHPRVATRARAGGGHVRASRSVAALAGNSRHGVRWIKVIADVHSGCMAAETGRGFFRRNLPSQGVFQRVRYTRGMVWRNGDAEVAKKTYARFLEISFVLKQKTLPAAAASENPQNRPRK